MEKLYRSICSTCIHASYCVLTTNKSNISSCSEYVHKLDKDYLPGPTEPIDRSNSWLELDHKEFTIN